MASFRFSLKSLIMFVLVAGVALGWFGIQARRKRAQDGAVAVIRENGGAVTYANNPNGNRSSSPIPDWLKNAIGGQLYSKVVSVELYRSPVTVQDLEHLLVLTNLEELTLEARNVTDAGLSHVSKLSSLKVLNLQTPRVTDTGLGHLSRLAKLEGLYLDGCPSITDRGLAKLTSLKQLTALGLRDCIGITDEGLVHLIQFKELDQLNLKRTQISDDGMVQIGKLTGLTNLRLDNTLITDAGLVRLSGLRKLETLRLPKGISDKSVELLIGFRKLRILDIGQTQISANGVQELRRRLPPNVDIDDE